MTTTLLIDADVLLWRASSAVQRTYDFGGGVFAVGADYGRARDKFDREVRELLIKLKADNLLMALSDPKRNWRKEVMPTYKANRGHAKPKVFWQLREHVESEYPSRWFPGLEGDDVLGLYATGKSIEGKKIIVSIDKDLQTVPGYLYDPNKPERGVRRIETAEADEYHFMQTLTGDRVDNYPGCPGVGPKRAAQALYLAFTPEEKWRTIVRLYRQKGLDDSHALKNAQVAHILRRGEYDKETYHVTLWTPPQTSSTPSNATAAASPPSTPSTPSSASPAKKRAASGGSRRRATSRRASPSATPSSPTSTHSAGSAPRSASGSDGIAE